MVLVASIPNIQYKWPHMPKEAPKPSGISTDAMELSSAPCPLPAEGSSIGGSHTLSRFFTTGYFYCLIDIHPCL